MCDIESDAALVSLCDVFFKYNLYNAGSVINRSLAKLLFQLYSPASCIEAGMLSPKKISQGVF